MKKYFNKNLYYLLCVGFIFLFFFCSSNILLADESNLITEKFYSESGDGTVDNAYSGWDDIHDGEQGVKLHNGENEVYITVWTQWNGYIIRRAFLPFNTNSIPEKAEIVSASLFVMPSFIDDKQNRSVGLVNTTQSSVEYLIMDDYDQCGEVNNPVEGAGRIELENQTVRKYSEFILNNIGKEWINKEGFTKLGIRYDLDMDDTVVTNETNSHFKIYLSESPGTSTDPYLEVTYYIPDGPSTKIDPVILIPGIMGSWEKDNKWQIDPILHTYDGLIEAMINNEYKLNDNLFLFPYNWRQNNSSTSKELMVMIDDIKGDDGDKVDIVAHSMGGLVARSYIESDDYADDIDQIIFLGTPHHGAVEDYLMYEGGYMPGIKGGILKFVFLKEALNNNYGSFVKYVGDKIPSVKQLLPDYSYLYDKETALDWNLRIYPTNYPINNFLENLNTEDGLDRLENRVDVLNIYSTIDINKTISSLRVVSDYNNMDNKWEHGYPKDLYNDNENCMVVGPGDGTVPEFSHNIFSSDSTKVIDGVDHRGIVTKAQQEIIKELTGSSTDDYYAGAWPMLDRILFIKAYSPINIMVMDSDTNKVGINVSGAEEYSQIAGAFYSGSDDPEFITIPEPIPGDYQIIVYGQDNDLYKLGVDILGDNLLENKEKLIAGVIGVGKTEVFDFAINEDGEIINIIENINFDLLLEDLDELHNYGEIKKQNKYKWLKLKFKHLEKIYDKYQKINKFWLKKILKKRIEIGFRITKKELNFYLKKEWITQDAHNVLSQDLEFILNSFPF